MYPSSGTQGDTCSKGKGSVSEPPGELGQNADSWIPGPQTSGIGTSRHLAWASASQQPPREILQHPEVLTSTHQTLPLPTLAHTKYREMNGVTAGQRVSTA